MVTTRPGRGVSGEQGLDRLALVFDDERVAAADVPDLADLAAAGTGDSARPAQPLQVGVARVLVSEPGVELRRRTRIVLARANASSDGKISSARRGSPPNRHEIDDGHQLATETESYRQLFNTIRPHQSLAGRRPLDVHLEACQTPPTPKQTEPETLPERDGLHWPHCDGLKWPHLPSGFLLGPPGFYGDWFGWFPTFN